MSALRRPSSGRPTRCGADSIGDGSLNCLETRTHSGRYTVVVPSRLCSNGAPFCRTAGLGWKPRCRYRMKLRPSPGRPTRCGADSVRSGRWIAPGPGARAGRHKAVLSLCLRSNSVPVCKPANRMEAVFIGWKCSMSMARILYKKRRADGKPSRAALRLEQERRSVHRYFSRSSAIWMALVAAPLRIWSPQHHSDRPFSWVRSSRMRPTNTMS